MVRANDGTYIGKLLLMFVLAFAMDFVCGSPEADSCLNSADNGGGSGLLQAAHPTATKAKSTQSSNAFAKRASPTVFQQGKPGIANLTLPPELFTLGLSLLKTEEALDNIVTNVYKTAFDFPWTQGSACVMVTLVGDAAPAYPSDEDFYGLLSLGDTPADNTGILNMVDVGGNIGLITIGAYMKNRGRMHIVAVEPSPSTYFLLRWNLWLNAIPVKTLAEFQASPDQPGVLALNNGVGDVDGQTFGLCYTPPLTQNAFVCDCSADDAAKTPKLGVQQCQQIVSYTVPSLFSLFKGRSVSMMKMDCEGCEKALLPALAPGQPIPRFSGELHAVSNQLEDIVCNYDQGRFFIHVCFNQGRYDVVWLRDRCLQGPTRPSCQNP